MSLHLATVVSLGTLVACRYGKNWVACKDGRLMIRTEYELDKDAKFRMSHYGWKYDYDEYFK